MKRIFFIIALFYYNNLVGQISNFRNYQEKINNAEMNLVKGKKEESLNAYYEILTASKGNFCKDIYNAMLLSTELSRTDTFFVLLNLIKTKGLNNTYLNSLEEFKSFHKNRKWKQFELENNHFNINTELRSKIDSLEFKDQLFRLKEGSYEVYGDTIHKIDSANLYYLYSLLYASNFPGEDEIGVSSITGSQGYDIVFLHYTQRTSLDENQRMPKITPILVNLVLEGKVLPNKCASWLESQNGEFKAGVSDICNFKMNGVATNYYAGKYSYENKLLLNEYRKWICLETFEEYLEKFKFKIKNPEAKYFFDIQKTTLDNIDEKMLKMITRNMIELK